MPNKDVSAVDVVVVVEVSVEVRLPAVVADGERAEQDARFEGCRETRRDFKRSGILSRNNHRVDAFRGQRCELDWSRAAEVRVAQSRA